MDKVVQSATEAIKGLQDGATIMIGGFGLCGSPEGLVQAIAESKVKDLTIIACTGGTDDHGLGLLLRNRQVKKLIASYIGENAILERQYLDGELAIEFCPQGTLAERIRAAGAGIGGFYTPTGYGTEWAADRETREIDGKWYVLESPLKADLALVKAWKADRWGNLVFRKTARNYNPLIATAATVTVAEVEQVVELGAIEPDQIVTPAAYVDHVWVTDVVEKPIERLTTRPRE